MVPIGVVQSLKLFSLRRYFDSAVASYADNVDIVSVAVPASLGAYGRCRCDGGEARGAD
jgi:hypothetical protein